LAGVAGLSDDACLLAQRLDQLHRAVGMRPGFGVERDDVGPRVGKILRDRVDRRDHQMDIERLGCCAGAAP
jgi:hypothetical protein